ncbi:MAG: ribonuclease Y [Ruminococcaceae bacterium]|nr:ribonuclease Y [Oscillospiraceae bacterium]
MGEYGIIAAIAAAIIGVILGAVIGIIWRKKVAEKLIGSAEKHAESIVEDAKKDAEQKKKAILVEAKEDAIKVKNEAEREIKERRNEVSRIEKKLAQREDQLEKKLENAEKKEEQLKAKEKEYDEKLITAQEIEKKQQETLEKISKMSVEEAKAYLLEKVETEVRREAALKITEIEQELKDTADEKARDIITLAIQRCAANHVSESTVSVVDLPNDDMKGRIIGREGRNIRTIETLTGVDLIIDDTPEAITLSSFDPMRREVARLTIEKLVTDGRIHPARIEESVEKSKAEVDAIIKREGEQAVLQTGIHGINSELIKLLGRLKYRTSYGQNVLMHSVEVAYISGIIADELGIDSALAKRAGLLHDIGKAVNHEVEGSHTQLGVDLARKYRESKEVLHAIEAHHGDIEPQTLVAVIVQAADAISAARPGARRENLESYIKRLQKLEEIANSFEGVDKSYAIQAGRELRLMVKPELVNDDKMAVIARDIVKQIEQELEYPGQIKVHVIRESRSIEYAK